MNTRRKLRKCKIIR